MNVPRVRAHAFFGHARASGPAAAKRYSSTGVELLADVNVFAFPVPLFVGTRYSYLLPTGQSHVGAIFQLDY